MKGNVFWPSSMKNQIFLLSALPIIVLAIFAVLAKSVADIKQEQREWASFTSGQLLVLVDSVRRAGSDAERDSVLLMGKLAGFAGELRKTPERAQVPNVGQPEELREHLVERLAALAENTMTEQPSAEIIIAVDTSRLLAFRISAPQNLSAYGPNLAQDALWVGLLTIPVFALSFGLSYLIINPLTNFTQMARRVSQDGVVSNLFVVGNSAELRSLAEPFNALAARVKATVEERAQMLRAMGHDLRTPLTRLRMRAEWCPDHELQRQMLLDIDTITGMVDENMSYLKDMTADVGVARRADLTSLLQTVVAGYADMGVSISFSGPPRLPLTCKPKLLARAVSNLIDNASRYAEEIEVTLEQYNNGEVIIAVNDNGPGLTDDMKLKVMEPFFRANVASPARSHGGVGLGLAIAYGIAGRHGGTLTLHDRLSNGLSARLTIRSLEELEHAILCDDER
ncbi:sensor histidine kinase [Rhizobium sp. LEGMi135b]